MCLAKAYVSSDNEKELLMEEIASLQVKNDTLLIKTLFGEEREIGASIREIDFMASSIVLENMKG